MTAIETAAAALAKASLFDPTFSNPDRAMVVAWAEVLGEIGRNDALTVVSKHYATKATRIMPADVIAGVKRIRADRLARYGNAEPDHDPNDVLGYQRATVEHRRNVADGQLEPVVQQPSIEGQVKVRELVDRFPMPSDARQAFAAAIDASRRRRAAERAAKQEQCEARRMAVRQAAAELEDSTA